MKLLSTEVIDKYDYLKTNQKVKEYMSKFEDDYYRYVSILPPSISSHLSEIKVQSSFSNTSSISVVFLTIYSLSLVLYTEKIKATSNLISINKNWNKNITKS